MNLENQDPAPDLLVGQFGHLRRDPATRFQVSSDLDHAPINLLSAFLQIPSVDFGIFFRQPVQVEIFLPRENLFASGKGWGVVGHKVSSVMRSFRGMGHDMSRFYVTNLRLDHFLILHARKLGLYLFQAKSLLNLDGLGRLAFILAVLID